MKNAAVLARSAVAVRRSPRHRRWPPVCYSLHSHEFFSIGAITGGVSTYVNGERRMQVSAGDLVVINPQQAHACNPIADRRWSYIMFYLDLARSARCSRNCSAATATVLFRSANRSAAIRRCSTA